MNTTTLPRERTEQWTVGDLVQVGGTRWIIRTLTDVHVELEATSVSPGIWWRTTLDCLPDKVVTA